ncbi:uncharacterized protein LOC135214844 isoform X2 [Macrobrachium nipponense]
MYIAVKRMWDMLWTLPRNIPIHAEELLHAYLMPSSGEDFSQSFLIALAANLRRITVYQWSGYIPLRQTSTFNDCYGYCQAYQLQTLDLTGVDLEFDTSALEGLLPKCLSLNVLKLGSNGNKVVLALAKQYCPLTVLHITEPQPWNKQLSLPTLMEVFFDVTKDDPEKLLKKIGKRKNPHMRAAWPNLSNLSTGYCDLTNEFFVLAWIVFKKLKYVHSSVNRTTACEAKYLQLRSKVPDLGPLAIGKYFSFVDNIPYIVEDLVRVACDIETFTIYMSSDRCKNLYEHFEKLSEASLCPKAVRLMNIRTICQAEPKRGTFSLFGKRAKKLQLDGALLGAVDIKDLSELLLDFPNVEELTLEFRHGLSCSSDELPGRLVFPQVSSLFIRPVTEADAYNQLFQMLPHIRELVFLRPSVKIIKKLAIDFKLLPELRVLKIADWDLVHLPGVLDVPNDIQYRERFKLYGPSDTLSCEDVRSLSNSAWNYFPKSASTLEAESRDQFYCE